MKLTELKAIQLAELFSALSDASRARKEGRQVFYTLEDEHVQKLYSMGLDHIEHG